MKFPSSASLDSSSTSDLLLSAILIAIVALSCNVFYLGAAPLSGTEGHRALTAHEMVTSGQWLIPTLYGEIYLRKPPLHYWTLATLESVTGIASPWIWRLPSATCHALLCGVIAWFGGRWFGRRAAWVSGVACLAIVPLWSQARSADIDSANTFASTLTALLLVEIIVNRPARIGWWTTSCGVMFGASLLLKGPAGLPIIIGAMLGPSLASRDWNWVKRPHVWSALAIGFALFSLYAFVALLSLHSSGHAADTSGINEGLENVFKPSISRLADMLLLVPTLVVTTLPVSLGFVVTMTTTPWPTTNHRRNRVAVALLWTIGTAWAVCVASGMVNPRYAYVTLPLLAPLAGLVASEPRSRLVKPWLVGSAVLFVCVLLGVSIYASGGFGMVSLLVASLVAAGATIWAVVRRSEDDAFSGLVFVIIFAAMGFAALQKVERTRRSGFEASAKMRQVVGESNVVTAGKFIAYQPEIFYYADVRVRSVRNATATPDNVPDGGWVAVIDNEWKQWTGNARVVRHVEFVSNEKPCHLIYVTAAPRPTAAQ